MMKELSTIISEVSFAFNCSVLEPNIIVLEQLLHEFPWYNILDAWWGHQPKYSSELYSNSAVGGGKIVSDYNQIINTPNLPALDLLPTPDAKDSSQNFGETDSLGLDLGSYSTSQPYADPFTGPQLGESALH